MYDRSRRVEGKPSTFKHRSLKAVITFVEDMAASGGYWLACTGTEIHAARSSIVGSIGVISASFGSTS